MKSYNKFKSFQVRWKEKLGDKNNPYLVRYTFLFFNFSIRIHHWIRSDDERAFHDHAYNFISILLKGSYYNITPNSKKLIKAPFVWYSKATDQHYLKIVKEAWTIVLCSKPFRKWRFYINNKSFRPLEYFHRYGVQNK